MVCDRHSWWFASPCPKCAALEQWKDTQEAPHGTSDSGSILSSHPSVGLVDDGYVEPPLPIEDPEDTYAIPAFLQLRPEGGWKYPSLHGGSNARPGFPATGTDRSLPLVGTKQPTLKEWTDEELLTAINNPGISLNDRQPIIMEARRREDREKTYARLEKANFLGNKSGHKS